MPNSANNPQILLTCLGLVIALLSACSGNSLILSTVYNRADNTLAKNFYRYADFDEQQRGVIKASIDQYHFWHRKQQLPEYIGLITEVRDSLANTELLTDAKIESWSERGFKFREQLIQCNPLMYSASLLQQLSEEQIQQIEERFAEMAEKSAERRAKKTDEERKADREKRLVKNFKRAGLKLNAEQKEMVFAASERNISLREPWQIFWPEWKQDFVTLLRQNEQSQFPLKLQQHLNEFWYMADQRHPEIVNTNRKNWAQLLLQIGDSLSPEQQSTFLNFLNDLINSLEKISADTPSVNLTGALAVPEQCQRKTEST